MTKERLRKLATVQLLIYAAGFAVLRIWYADLLPAVFASVMIMQIYNVISSWMLESWDKKDSEKTL